MLVTMKPTGLEDIQVQSPDNTNETVFSNYVLTRRKKHTGEFVGAQTPTEDQGLSNLSLA